MEPPHEPVDAILNVGCLEQGATEPEADIVPAEKVELLLQAGNQEAGTPAKLDVVDIGTGSLDEVGEFAVRQTAVHHHGDTDLARLAKRGGRSRKSAFSTTAGPPRV